MNNSTIPQPQEEPFLPEGGWQYYYYDKKTLVPAAQVNEVLNKIVASLAKITELKNH